MGSGRFLAADFVVIGDLVIKHFEGFGQLGDFLGQSGPIDFEKFAPFANRLFALATQTGKPHPVADRAESLPAHTARGTDALEDQKMAVVHDDTA